jgi:erythromycin esterase-like protein
MAQKYGQDLVVIGNIVPKAVCKNPVCAAPPVRPDSLETVFQKVFGDQPALVDARKIAAANRALPLNTAGSLYADINQGHFINVVLNRQFDAVLYLPETTATFEDK